MARSLAIGWAIPLFALVNLRFPGIRFAWSWGNVSFFVASMIPPFVVLARSAKWPAGVRRGITMIFTVPAALLALGSSGCASFDVLLNGVGPLCEARSTLAYARTDVVVNWCCEGGAIGDCRIEADQVWHILPGLRMQRALDSVVHGDEATDIVLNGNVLDFRVQTSHGESVPVKARLKRWVWL